MSLSEVEFFFFFFAVFAVHWLMPRRAPIQNVVLLLASLVFYVTWNPRLLGLFVVSSIVDYVVLRKFAASPLPSDDDADADKKRDDAMRARRTWLYVSLVANIGVLVVFKYINSVSSLLKLGLPGIALPLGISFYTMSRIGVVVDTYYDRVKPVDSILEWLAFVSFFPQLIAGPIGRHELLEQYKEPRKLDPKLVVRALREIAIGFILKIYVAAHASAWVDPIFAAPGTFTRKAHLFAIFGYGIQVYGDFAGYSLIAIGVGRLFGLGLPDNFNFPYLSTNPREVWRRWHMSLNNWLFDYIYSFMVTGDGFLSGRLGAGLVVVMLISGIWHGSAWTYVLWGLLHGLWLLAHYRYDLYYKSLCRKDRDWVARRKSKGYLLLGWAVTVGFFLLTLVPFRASSLGAVGAFARGVFVGGTETTGAGLMHPGLAALFVIGYHVQALSPFDKLRERFIAAPAIVRGLALGIVVIFLFLFAPVGAGTFIYAQF